MDFNILENEDENLLTLNYNQEVYIKNNVSQNEYDIFMHVHNLKICNIPTPIYYSRSKKIFIMQKIPEMNIADLYGESSKNIPISIFIDIRIIIKKLYENGIIYPDITGYNFIEYDNKIWIIDFGDSYFRYKQNDNYFVNKFLQGHNGWNPEYK